MSLSQPQTRLIKDLIRFDTTSVHSNLDLITYVANYLDGSGANVRLDHNHDGSKANLLATIGPQTQAGGIILSGHTDTVPVTGQNWRTNPYDITEENGKLYARGSADMKVFCALALAEFDGIARERAQDLQRPLHLLLTYDEELGCFGAKNWVKTYGNQLITDSKALEVNKIASASLRPALPGSTFPVIINTNAVIVHTKTVSINGSNRATSPSEAGYLVRTAECAIEAEPTPASLEKAALLNPCIKTPMAPPAIPIGENAPSKISAKAAPIISYLANPTFPENLS